MRQRLLRPPVAEGERVRLQPANSMMGPIYASARDVMVQGVVVGLMRRF